MLLEKLLKLKDSRVLQRVDRVIKGVKPVSSEQVKKNAPGELISLSGILARPASSAEFHDSAAGNCLEGYPC